MWLNGRRLGQRSRVFDLLDTKIESQFHTEDEHPRNSYQQRGIMGDDVFALPV